LVGSGGGWVFGWCPLGPVGAWCSETDVSGELGRGLGGSSFGSWEGGLLHLIERGVLSMCSWSSGGRSRYFEESMAVGRCLGLASGFFGTRFKSPFFVGNLCVVL
jgi:hypothetical protein